MSDTPKFVNKVEFGDKVLIDLTSDTVSEETVIDGITFHSADGIQRVGTAVTSGAKIVELTQTEYDALSYVDPDVAYFIKDGVNERTGLEASDVIYGDGTVADALDNTEKLLSSGFVSQSTSLLDYINSVGTDNGSAVGRFNDTPFVNVEEVSAFWWGDNGVDNVNRRTVLIKLYTGINTQRMYARNIANGEWWGGWTTVGDDHIGNGAEVLVNTTTVARTDILSSGLLIVSRYGNMVSLMLDVTTKAQAGGSFWAFSVALPKPVSNDAWFTVPQFSNSTRLPQPTQAMQIQVTSNGIIVNNQPSSGVKFRGTFTYICE